jgi:hypothetical protein
MPDGLRHPDPALQATALWYAAGDLAPAEAAAFENRLATDQAARDALSEAVRLSAAALGQAAPVPSPSLRSVVRDRLWGGAPPWLARRLYRGHPLAWAGLGAVLVGTASLLALGLTRPAEFRDSSEGFAAQLASPVPPHEESGTDPAAESPEPETGATAETVPAAECETVPHTVAEFWAEWSTPEHVEKTHEDETRWRLKLQSMPGAVPGRGSTPSDSREP